MTAEKCPVKRDSWVLISGVVWRRPSWEGSAEGFAVAGTVCLHRLLGGGCGILLISGITWSKQSELGKAVREAPLAPRSPGEEGWRRHLGDVPSSLARCLQRRGTAGGWCSSSRSHLASDAPLPSHAAASSSCGRAFGLAASCSLAGSQGSREPKFPLFKQPAG